MDYEVLYLAYISLNVKYIRLFLKTIFYAYGKIGRYTEMRVIVFAVKKCF